MLHASIAELGAAYLQQLECASLGTRLVLGGYSMGGMIAYEVACKLEAEGRSVEAVILIDTPSRYCAKAHSDEPVTAHGLLFFAQMLAGRHMKRFDLTLEELQQQQPSERIAYMIAKLQEQKLLESSVDFDLFHSIYRMIRHNEDLSREFRASSFHGKVVLIRTEELAEEFRAETTDVYDDRSFGWQRHCTQDIDVRSTPGHHFNVLYEPYAGALASTIRAVVDDLPSPLSSMPSPTPDQQAG